MLRNDHSIKVFILKTAFLFSALGFLLIYVAATQAYREAVKSSAIEASQYLATSTFNSMYALMEQGWSREQLQRFLDNVRNNNSFYDVDIYRGKVVSSQFGYIDQTIADDFIQSTFTKGLPQTNYENENLRYSWPLIADSRCLRCHTGALEDSVLGVIEINQNPEQLATKADNGLLSNLLLLAPLPFLLSFFVIRHLTRRINRSVRQLEQSIEQIEKVSDLSNLQLDNSSHGFAELDGVYEKVSALAKRMHDVAVDKDLLEFEIQLLEKFVITSEVVRDWREHMDVLLFEINKIMPVYNLYSVFKVEEELFSLEIFWLKNPSDESKYRIEKQLLQTLENNHIFEESAAIEFHHHVASPDQNFSDLELNLLVLQSKTLVIDNPQIVGVVGISAHPEIKLDHTRQLIANSILSTLINVIGSVRAIYKYTKDLEYYATRDPLTGLNNQRIFWELLENQILRAERNQFSFCIMVVDLDNFKIINDDYGHSFGDLCLQEISQCLRQALRAGDLLARYGGDEFAVILPDSNIDSARQVAQRMLSQLSCKNIKTPQGDAANVSLSIGIATYPDHAKNSKELFMFADNMMYRAKSQGKNQVHVPDDGDVLETFRGLNEISRLVSRAIKEKTLIPYFQPLVSTANNEIKAVEVLARIKTEDGSIVGAHDFIEIAEKLGLIHQLDYIILEKSLIQANQEGYQGLLFVNISPRSLVLAEFIPKMKQLVTSAEIDNSRIVFEITERDTVKNMVLLEKFVNNLKAEGFQLAIDDFGSGFSSFHYLKHFPIDYVKIEGEFIANMVHSHTDQAVVRCIYNLADELQAKTIAEYVESQEVLDAVKAIGISYAQGYHIRRPTPYIIDNNQRRLRLISN